MAQLLFKLGRWSFRWKWIVIVAWLLLLGVLAWLVSLGLAWTSLAKIPGIFA